VHTIGPFNRSHEILQARRAATLEAVDNSVLDTQGENPLNGPRERRLDAAMFGSAFDQMVCNQICLVYTARMPCPDTDRKAGFMA